MLRNLNISECQAVLDSVMATNMLRGFTTPSVRETRFREDGKRKRRLLRMGR